MLILSKKEKIFKEVKTLAFEYQSCVFSEVSDININNITYLVQGRTVQDPIPEMVTYIFSEALIL